MSEVGHIDYYITILKKDLSVRDWLNKFCCNYTKRYNAVFKETEMR